MLPEYLVEILAPIRRFWTSNLPVARVEHLMDRDLASGPVAVRITSKEMDLWLAADGLDDSIMVRDAAPFDVEDLIVEDFSEHNPWCGIAGAKLTWGWILTNHQGYIDGAQLEFRNEATTRIKRIQLITMASTLDIREVPSAK